jgi:hypothetical protein
LSKKKTGFYICEADRPAVVRNGLAPSSEKESGGTGFGRRKKAKPLLYL